MAIFGTSGDDTMTYTTSNSPLEIYGLEGNDTIQGGNASDYLNGGAGNDTLLGSVGNDILVGEDGNDVMYANVGEDQLFGGAGNDVLNGSAQNNVLDGSSGDDGINGYDGNDAIDAGTGRDIVDAGEGNDRIVVDGSFADGTDSINGGGGNDVFVLSGLNFSLVDSSGLDRIEISLSFSLAGYGAIEDLTLTGGAAINGTGNDLANTMAGNDAANALDGGGGNDLIRGYGGNDTLTAGFGGGTEYLYGGLGNDTFVVMDAEDRPVEFDGEGYDTVRSDVRFVLGGALEALTLTGAASVNGFGNALANAMTGNSGSNYLDGGLELDTLTGGLGDDYYALGDSTAIAGANTWDTVTEAAGAGIDTVAASADVGRYTYQLTDNVENLIATGVSIFRLWGNEIGNGLTGNAAANEIAGYGGADTMDGKAGYDRIAGGAGDDTYILDDISQPSDFSLFAFDDVTEASGEGLDTVRVNSLESPDQVSTYGYTLTANVENGLITGADAFNLSGNEVANALTGNGANNVLTGGGAGDQLNGGLGSDTLRGGTGDDTYFLTDLSEPNDFSGFVYDGVVEAGSEGTDTVVVTAIDNPDTFASIDRYTLGASIENGRIAGSIAFNLSGNELANALTGNFAANVLNGLAGADRMEGGSGDDTYVVDNAGDAVFEAVAGGFDTVNVSLTYALAAGQEIESFSTSDAAATAAINLTGNQFGQALYGNAGANTLDGRGGADFMQGYAGNDLYYVDNSGDQVVEAAGGGTDRVLASLSYALGAAAQIEFLTTTSAALTTAINLTGNGLAQFIYGNAGGNTLDGLGGIDIMTGYAGNDNYHVDNAGDVVIEAAGGGSDHVYASVSYTLGAAAQVEYLFATNAALATAINLTGNAFAQQLLGNAGANTLDGKGGADFMQAYAGNDIYYVDNAGDQIAEVGNGGTDRVLASVSYVLSAVAQVEVLSTTTTAGAAAINLTGNGFNQFIYGNAGANIIDGNGGVDTMTGYSGNDFYYVDNAADQVIESAGGGTDRVLASISYTLGAAASIEILSTTTAAGTAAINLTGNGFNQFIYGNAGANTLNGKAGADTMTGYGGADSFVFDTALGASNIDRIADYNVAADTMRIDNAVFAGAGLIAGQFIPANAFVIGSAATSVNQHIIYNSATGDLIFDSNGSGAGGSQVFAHLATGLTTMTNADFFVI